MKNAISFGSSFALLILLFAGGFARVEAKAGQRHEYSKQDRHSRTTGRKVIDTNQSNQKKERYSKGTRNAKRTLWKGSKPTKKTHSQMKRSTVTQGNIKTRNVKPSKETKVKYTGKRKKEKHVHRDGRKKREHPGQLKGHHRKHHKGFKNKSGKRARHAGVVDRGSGFRKHYISGLRGTRYETTSHHRRVNVRRPHKTHRHHQWRPHRVYRPHRSVHYGKFFHRPHTPYRPVYVGGAKYYYRHGGFFRWHNRSYVSISAPLGAVVVSIPLGHLSFKIGGGLYYYFGGTYYKRYQSHYRVVHPPVGIFLHDLPSGAVEVYDGGYTYFELNGIHYRRHLDGYIISQSPYQDEEETEYDSDEEDEEEEYGQTQVKEYHTFMVDNTNGSQTPVQLEKIAEHQWKGERGEIYNGMPTEKQLRQAYGF